MLDIETWQQNDGFEATLSRSSLRPVARSHLSYPSQPTHPHQRDALVTPLSPKLPSQPYQRGHFYPLSLSMSLSPSDAFSGPHGLLDDNIATWSAMDFTQHI